MTMKKIALLAAGFLIGSAAFAQTTVPPVKWGLKAGVSLPRYHYQNNNGDDHETGSTTNFHITGYADVPVSTYFSVQPGISLQGKGGKFWDTNDLEYKHNTMWIEVPINFVGKVPLGTTGAKLFLGAGPYVAFGIHGETELENTNNGDSMTNDFSFGNGSDDALKGTDAGVNFLGGFEFSNGINIGAGYGLGLVDLRPNGEGGNGKMTQRVLSFSLGYSF